MRIVIACSLIVGIGSACGLEGHRGKLPAAAAQCTIDRWKGGTLPAVGGKRVKAGDIIDGARILEINGPGLWIDFEFKGKRLRESCREVFSA